MLLAQCPACHARYKVPDEVAGRRARCKKCGQPFQIPELPPDSGRLSLTALSGVTDEGSTVIQNRIQLDQATRSKTGTGVQMRGENVKEEKVAAPGVWGPFLRAVVSSLWSPVRPFNIGPFLVMWIVLTVCSPAVRSFFICPLLGVAVGGIIYGWYFSFQFNTVVNAADGKEELPALTLTSGFMDDVLIPLVKMVATTVLALLPALVFLVSVTLARGGSMSRLSGLNAAPGASGVYLSASGNPADVATPIVTLVLLAAGYALWPMLVLVGAVGGTQAMFRIDLIIQTLVRTIPAYVCVVIAVYASQGSNMLLQSLMGLGEAEQVRSFTVSSLIIVPALATLVEVYLTIVAMRVIGLYYHHFKHKFAWSWG